MNFKKRLIIYLVGFPTIVLCLVVSYKILEKKLSFNFPFTPPFNYINGSFSKTLEEELIKNNISQHDRLGIISAYKRKIDFRKLGENDFYTIAMSSNVFKYITIEKNGWGHSVFKKGEKYFYSSRKLPTEEFKFKIEGELKNNLWDSMTKKKILPDIILDFTDLFSGSIDFLTEVRDGDKFVVFYSLTKTKTGNVLSKKIEAALYEGLETGKKLVIEFNGNYYDEKGEGAKSMFLKAPLNYRRISSYFTYNRFHPILKYVRPHLGIDYAAPTGTPVSSVADGRVIFKGWKGGYGNFVEIKHSGGYATTYGHLSRYASGLYIGKRVKQGDVIGYVGATGIATGPHLDFRIKLNGKFLNYLKMKRKATLKLPSRYKEIFFKKLEEYFPQNSQ